MEKNKNRFTGKAIVQFIILCTGAYAIYMPVFCRSAYYDALLEAFQVSNTEFASLFSTYTLMSLLTYFFGGVLADKFPPRYLLAISYVGTAAFTFWQMQFPSFGMALIIYGGMGVTTTLTFWSALIKATRQFGQLIGGESKALGFLEGGRAVSGMFVSTFCVWLFAKGASHVVGLRNVLAVYAVVMVFCGIGAWFVFNDEEQAREAVAQESLPKLIMECMKNKYVWICCLTVMGAYALTSTLSGYASSIGKSCFSLTVVVAAMIPTITTYIVPIGSFTGGFLGDKLGGARTLRIGVLGTIIAAFIITILPSVPAMGIPFIVIFCITTIFMGAVRGQFYAPLREIGIPMHLSGTAVGLIATLGYSPDLFLPLITGRLLDTMDPVTAYKIVIYILIAFGIFSMLMATVIVSHVKKNDKAKQSVE